MKSPEYRAARHLAAEIMLKTLDGIEVSDDGDVLVGDYATERRLAGIGILAPVIIEYLGVSVDEIPPSLIEQIRGRYAPKYVKFKLLLDGQFVLHRFPALLKRYAVQPSMPTGDAGESS